MVVTKTVVSTFINVKINDSACMLPYNVRCTCMRVPNSGMRLAIFISYFLCFVMIQNEIHDFPK